MTMLQTAPGFNFDKGRGSPVIGYNIYFTQFSPVIQREDFIAQLFEMVASQLFTFFAQKGSCAAHESQVREDAPELL